MIAIGSDHGGFALKTAIISHLEDRGIEFKDYGTYNTDSCNYPDYAEKVSKAVVSGECDRGILVCGTGIGISIAANKIKGIRCALCGDCFSAEMARAHNDANIVALGDRVLGVGLALKIVDTFLDSKFEGGRHADRVGLITKLDQR